MNNLIEISKPQLPDIWNYEQSVKKTKNIIYKWKSMTEELADELWIAREKLSSQGKRTDLTSEQKFQSWTGYCKDIGNSRQVVNRWLKQWFTPELPHVAQSTGEDEWYTPPKYTDAAREVMGSINLDPASSENANKNVGAERIMTLSDDGLNQKWEGNVWLNPPYSQPLIDKFSEKVTEKYMDGEIEQACILVNNATETKWCQRMLEKAPVVCFVKGRVKFLDGQGKGTGAPLQGQVIIYMGDSPERFYNEFKKFGVILWNKEAK